ncbi:MAG TPA: phage antirepressor N-terminal domain-containing protein [Candidatus Ozemobacteraceae bacterium]|nr:phage antirepressor N-terminal domain-containing protein [Candidatus Ozemobacteraceae bacterium]
MTIQSQLVPVAFHGDTLFIVSHQGEPFTPVRPIVENMGLTWGAQQKKLHRSSKRWGVAILATPTKTGPQETLCMPLRKLAGFLATIEPRKVRPEIRAKIELYQAECDDALWAYWTKGQATNPRANAVPAAPTIGPDEMVLKKDRYISMLEAQTTSQSAHIAALQRLIEEKEARSRPKHITAEDIRQIRELFAQGLSQGEISRRVRRSKATVHYVVTGQLGKVSRAVDAGGAL